MDWEKIRNEYESSKITLKALAEKYNVKLGTLKSRKSREGWSRGATKKDATKTKKVATNKIRDATPEPVIKNDELNDRQQMFCLYYIKYFNATKAYQKAYECDYRTANVNGSRLLVNASIKQEIERLKAERQSSIFLDGMAVLQKYIDIAFADITDFVEFGQRDEPTGLEGDGPEVAANYVIFKNYDEVDGTIITEVKEGRDGISVKLADKMRALEMLSKYFDLLSDNDKKRLQEEKLKAETQKAKAEAEKITKENTDDELEEIVIVDEWSDNDE